MEKSCSQGGVGVAVGVNCRRGRWGMNAGGGGGREVSEGGVHCRMGWGWEQQGNLVGG